MPNSFAPDVTAQPSPRWPAAARITAFPGLAPQIVLAFVLIELALWAPIGVASGLLALSAMACIMTLAATGEFSTAQMGLGRPQLRGSLWTIALGLALVAIITVGSSLLEQANAAAYGGMQLGVACLYAVWALLQQFLLQSFFFVRFERLLDGRRAVVAAALLFALAHLPNMFLTAFSFLGGLFFCEMFRRYRNIYALGLSHAVLGLTLAVSFSDSMIHSMRVGMAYLVFPS